MNYVSDGLWAVNDGQLDSNVDKDPTPLIFVGIKQKYFRPTISKSL